MHVSSASVSNAGMSFVMLKIKQRLSMEVAIRKFFNKDNGKYRNLHYSTNTRGVHTTEEDSANSGNEAENDWTDWQFSVSRALAWTHGLSLFGHTDYGSKCQNWTVQASDNWLFVILFTRHYTDFSGWHQTLKRIPVIHKHGSNAFRNYVKYGYFFFSTPNA